MCPMPLLILFAIGYLNLVFSMLCSLHISCKFHFFCTHCNMFPCNMVCAWHKDMQKLNIVLLYVACMTTSEEHCWVWPHGTLILAWTHHQDMTSYQYLLVVRTQYSSKFSNNPPNMDDLHLLINMKWWSHLHIMNAEYVSCMLAIYETIMTWDDNEGVEKLSTSN
jgi:hypothetical protein